MPPLLYTVLLLFVQRQRIVYDLLKELRPDLFLDFYRTPEKEFFAAREKYFRTPRQGAWGQDEVWEFFIHGKGCRIIHLVTQERIEWDTPDPLVFDRHWFTNYINWFKERTGYLSEVDTNDYLRNEMDKFVTMGLVEPIDYRYRILFKPFNL